MILFTDLCYLTLTVPTASGYNYQTTAFSGRMPIFFAKEVFMIDHITPKLFSYVLDKQELDVHYQPIVSVSKRSVIGFESLLRTYFQGEFISPVALFDYAAKTQNVHILDSICQTLALRRYVEGNHNKLLFINMESSLIDYYMKNMSLIKNIIDKMNIPRGKIVLEINEKRTENNEQLIELVNMYRDEGFLIALDDVGAGHSNMNRIVFAKPDIIKIDRSVIMNIDQNYYKQEVLRSLSELGQKIGSITLAEGVEREEEVITCVDCGVDWFQGFYFSKAIPAMQMSIQNYQAKCNSISEQYQKKTIQYMRDLSIMVQRRKLSFNKLIQMVMDYYPLHFEDFLSDYLNGTADLECVYILDENGIQITETMFNPASKFRNQEMFSPMGKGDSHISKPFFNYAIHNRSNIYVSTKYVSLATGNYCQTLSKHIVLSAKSGENGTLVVCADYSMT